MATSSFLNRWSQRKLGQATGQQDEEQLTNDPELILEESRPQALQVEDSTPAVDTESDSSSKVENTEEMSIASLLVSEASESVKKAALRKLFLSEEFNVRDGLDDYDDDYSNLKSLSEGVADTLRDWIKDKSEEELVQEQHAIQAEDKPESKDLIDSVREGGEIPEPDNELYENTVTTNTDT
ncbi:DUF3306 domain-containing protein [Vibrio alginolyticus]|nr:DUF3306 domain-containing protein [Vibrio alginolyticus]